MSQFKMIEEKPEQAFKPEIYMSHTQKYDASPLKQKENLAKPGNYENFDFPINTSKESIKKQLISFYEVLKKRNPTLISIERYND